MLAAILGAATGLLLVAYPFLVYFGLQHFQPRHLVLLLLVIAIIRLLSAKRRNGLLLYWLFAVSLVVIATLMLGSSNSLLFYPVIVSLSFLAFFAVSLYRPPTVIAGIAERMDGPLSAEALAYTRRVTVVWCIFFAINALLATGTIFVSREYWVLYNGLISYLLMGLLFVCEYFVRQRVKNKANIADAE